jgi:hypothetical protein
MLLGQGHSARLNFQKSLFSNRAPRRAESHRISFYKGFPELLDRSRVGGPVNEAREKRRPRRHRKMQLAAALYTAVESFEVHT